MCEKQDPSLFTWARNQKKYSKTTRQDKTARLKVTGFDFTPHSIPDKFDDNLENLRIYRDTVGKGLCHVPKAYRDVDSELYYWTMKERARRCDKKSPPEKYAKLDELGFVWHPKLDKAL